MPLLLSCAAQVEPASENEQLRKREAVLKRCVKTLSETHDQWIAAAEAEPPSLGGGASSPPRAAELELPPLPLLGERLAKLQGVAALHADQVELTLRRVSAMCDESALQRKQLSSSAHQASFSGCAARPSPLEPPARPRRWSRRHARSQHPAHTRHAHARQAEARAWCTGTRASTSPGCSSAAWCAHRSCSACGWARAREGPRLGWA